MLSSFTRPILALVLLSFATSPVWADQLTPGKKTILGLYMTAKEANAAVSKKPQSVLFVDARSISEVMFVGGPTSTDAIVPLLDLASPITWSAPSSSLQMRPNQHFVKDVEQRLAHKGLKKSDQVIIICRSGSRSAKAVNALAQAGFTNAWSVTDGFEGDAGKDGERNINGWKNARLPWTYQLDRAKIDLPSDAQ